MGIIHSIFCSISFCVERVLTWVCCATVLVLLLFTFITLMIYGISVGYHYAQKELVSFAVYSRTDKPLDETYRRRGALSKNPLKISDLEITSLRYGKIGKEDYKIASSDGLEIYRTKMPSGVSQAFWDTWDTEITDTTSSNEDSDSSKTDLTPYEKEMARRLLGRVRRSRNHNTTKKNSFFKRIKKLTQLG